jgi:hypothetical protein
VYRTGPAALLDLGAKIHEQAEWLSRENPDYLLTYPSNLDALVRQCTHAGISIPNLKQVIMLSEMLRPEVRARCRADRAENSRTSAPKSDGEARRPLPPAIFSNMDSPRSRGYTPIMRCRAETSGIAITLPRRHDKTKEHP